MSLPRTQSEKSYTYDHEKYSETKQFKSAHGIYNCAAVACDSLAGSLVGKQILEQNGSVVDAMISSLLCNSLLNAQSMGIGGGFFMLHYSKENEKITVIDARETAPLNSTANMFSNLSDKTKGGLSVAVPGEIKGYWQAHQMFGKLKWSKLFQPAIEMCNNGFHLPASQARFLKYCETKILSSVELREVFYNSMKNELYNVNSIIKRPKLAKTFEILAREGESAFYNGSLTDTIVHEIQTNGGIITRQDLQSYECQVKEPLTYSLKSNVLLNTVPSPSCGSLLNFILAILDSYEHDEFVLDSTHESALFHHRFVEASKFAFGLRHLVGDDSIADSSRLYEILSDKSVINEYKHKINDNTVHPINTYGTKNFSIDHGTAHTSIVGPNGDACAVTSSINLVFGSKIMGEKTNIIYNNQMDDFSTPNIEFNSFSLPNYSINFIEPGKRPVSSMTPLIALDQDKNVRLVCGSSGGTRIVTSTALVTARNIMLKQDLVQSVDDARLHHQLFPDEVLYENDFDPNVLDHLKDRGHRTYNFGFGGSAIQAIERLPDGRLQAVCDCRKGGVPSGF